MLIPKKISSKGNCGRFVAAIRTRPRNIDDKAKKEGYEEGNIFVTVDADSYAHNGATCFCVFYAFRKSTTGRLQRLIQFRSLEYNFDQLMECVQYLLDDWAKQFSHEVVELIRKNSTHESTVFTDRFLSKYSALKKIGMGFQRDELCDFFLANEAAPEKVADTKPVRTILPRADWMKVHYPNQATV